MRDFSKTRLKNWGVERPSPRKGPAPPTLPFSKRPGHFEPDLLRNYLIERLVGSLKGHTHGRVYDQIASALGVDPESLDPIPESVARQIIERFAVHLSTRRAKRRGGPELMAVAKGLAESLKSV